MRSARPQSTSTRVLRRTSGSSRSARNVAGSSDGFRPENAPRDFEPPQSVRERVQRHALIPTHLAAAPDGRRAQHNAVDPPGRMALQRIEEHGGAHAFAQGVERNVGMTKPQQARDLRAHRRPCDRRRPRCPSAARGRSRAGRTRRRRSRARREMRRCATKPPEWSLSPCTATIAARGAAAGIHDRNGKRAPSSMTTASCSKRGCCGPVGVVCTRGVTHAASAQHAAPEGRGARGPCAARRSVEQAHPSIVSVLRGAAAIAVREAARRVRARLLPRVRGNVRP